MSKEDDGGPAFPTNESNYSANWACPGMTLRDYFAAKALQGLLADLPKMLYGANWKADVAGTSYEIADAMMEARKK